jgi:hypothetical protein
MGQDHIEWVFDDAKATIIQRGAERDQADGERTIPRCVTAFNAITGHKLSNCDGWLFMEILKKCRSVQGAYKYDDYRDGVGYAALRAEEARMEEEERLSQLTCEAPVADCQDDCVEHRTCRTPAVEPSDFSKAVAAGTTLDFSEAAVMREYQRRKHLSAGSDLVPPECDERNELGCKHPYGHFCTPECDTRTTAEIQNDMDQRELRRRDG